MIVDDYSRCAWSYFAQKKKDLHGIFQKHVDKLQALGYRIQYIRCDNAGENVTGIQHVPDSAGIQVEYTAPYTPQQNGVVERCFVTIRWCSNAMLLKAALTEADCRLLWAEAAATATNLRNWISSRRDTKPPMSLFQHGNPIQLPTLVEFGKPGFVTRRGIQAHSASRARRCIMVGYAPTHTHDTYRLFDLHTRRIILSRDVVWTGRDPQIGEDDVGAISDTTPTATLSDGAQPPTLGPLEAPFASNATTTQPNTTTQPTTTTATQPTTTTGLSPQPPTTPITIAPSPQHTCTSRIPMPQVRTTGMTTR